MSDLPTVARNSSTCDAPRRRPPRRPGLGCPVTDTERYRRTGAQFGMVAHERGICGCHVRARAPNCETHIELQSLRGATDPRN